MKYVYDILLNFNDTNIYDFFEWSNEDDINYFKRVPLIRTSDDIYKKIKVGSIIDDKYLLGMINNVTEVYDNKIIRMLDYVFIVTNGVSALGIWLNQNGKVIMMSKMLIDEEDEAIEIGNLLEEKTFIVINSDKVNNPKISYLTRMESKKTFFLNKELDSLYSHNKMIKLKYLHYECFHKTEDNIDKIYNDLKQFLNQEWTNKHDELYDLVRLSYSKK